MTLKSSEVQDCSWWISTILVSFLVSSSSCHAFLPPVVRPMRAIQEMFLKLSFNSPELNCSIIFSMYMFSMTKKMNQFLRHFKIGDWIFSTSVQVLSRIGIVLWKNWQVLVFVVLLLPLIGMQNPSHPILTHILRAELLEFPARCCSNSRPICFEPWEIPTQEWELSLFMDMILISTPYLPCKQQVATSNTGPILVFPLIQPFGWAVCTHDKPLHGIVRILQCL